MPQKQQAMLMSPIGYLLKFGVQWWGRPASDISRCPGTNSGQVCPFVKNSNPGITNCENRNSCGIQATVERNGGQDPCPTIHKMNATSLVFSLSLFLRF